MFFLSLNKTTYLYRLDIDNLARKKDIHKNLQNLNP